MSSTCRMPAFILSVISLFLLASSAFLTAQDATGTIRGTVLDSSGSRIAQASIAIVNSATGKLYTAISNAEGVFALDLLPPGDYSARVVAEGMSPQVTPQLRVEIGGVTSLEFRLTIAGAHENVTVSAEPAVVNTQPAAVSTLLDERALNDMPLNGRRFSDLALFSPGVTKDPRSLTSATNGDLSFGGIRGFQNTFLVDGGDYNNAFFAQPRGRDRAPFEISTEVVQEFRVSTNAYGAEQGRSGGAVVNVVTKSGSNHLHGTSFYHFRDSSLGADDPFLRFARIIGNSSSEAPLAARSNATRFSFSPASISTSFIHPMWLNFSMGVRRLFRQSAPDLILLEITNLPIRLWCLPPRRN